MSATLPTGPHFERLLAELREMGDAATVKASDDARYQQFIQCFPASALGQLTLEEYCVGKGDGASFCWWLERGLQPVLGRYSPGTSRGHILYFLPDGTVYKNRLLAHLSDEDALRYTLAVQSVIAATGADEDWHWIDDSEEIYRRAGVAPAVTMGEGRKLRLLSAYHPELALPISSSDHLGHFLAQLGYSSADIPPANQPVARMLLLRQYLLLAREQLPAVSTTGFMRALYSPQLGMAPVRDDDDAATDELTVRLSGGAVRNGYVRYPKQQILFPEECIAQDEEAEATLFLLDLPDGSQISTCLLANRRRIKARFNALFSRLQVQEGDRATLRKLADGHYQMLLNQPTAEDDSAVEEASAASSEEQEDRVPLNQILFGPPGTGKTYATIDCALEVLDPAFLQANPGADAATRQRLKARFDQLVAEQRIRFVTFHQSFSYEDFVEGLRASSEDGQLHYRVEPGIFRQICADAVAVAGVPTLDELLQQFIEQVAEAPMTLETARGKRFSVSHRYGNTTLTCIPEASESARELPVNIEHVRQWLHGVRPTNIYCESYVRGVVEHVQQKLAAGGSDAAATTSAQAPFVLIIDEINRGNVSRIFGELITLIEPSKRAGADESLTVSLPYSREPFSVPGNLFIIGTMNTADRSLAGLDIALRRRFNFREMPPRPDLLNGLSVAGINIGELLTVMNQRIEVLLDRDHCLGHAYFMPLRADPTMDKLALIFSNQVLPLLQEYFFEDWQRIQWVLNDHRKPAADCFVKQAKPDVARLFGNVSVPAQGQGWWIDQQAFGRVTAYRGLISVVDTQPDTQDATEGEDA